MIDTLTTCAHSLADTLSATTRGTGLSIDRFGIDIPELLPLHWIIAYLGLSVHLLLKMAETPGSLFSGFTKRDVLITLASIISVPIILVVCTDTGLSEILPINYVTAFLAGYQTQSFLRTIGSIGGKYVGKTKEQS